MKKLVAAFFGASALLAALAAHGQISLPWPGPGAVGPSCTPNTAGGGTDANTIALYHFDGNGNNTGVWGPITNLATVGTATYSSTRSQFGGQSGFFTASGATAYFQTAANVAYVLGYSDLTIEWWEYWPSIPANIGWLNDSNASVYLAGQSSAGGTGWNALLAAGFANAGGGLWPLSQFHANQWQHVAMVLTNAATAPVVNMYVDGTRVGAGNATFSNGSTIPVQTGQGNAQWWFGRSDGSFFFFPTGSYIDEVRISTIARYSGASFTVPTQAFCDPQSSYVGPGDVASGAKAWWGTRAYNKAAAKATQKLVNIRRASDSVTCDVLADFQTGGPGITNACSSATSNGQTAFNFCSGTQCFVTKAYDQSGALQCGGAACDVSQATTANQPQFNFNCFYSFACIQYTTSSMTLASPTGPALTLPFSASGLGARTGAFAANGVFYSQGSTVAQFLYANVANRVELSNTGTSSTVTASDSANHSLTGIFNGASSSITVDGTNTAVTGVTGATTSGVFNLGLAPITATISEMGVWGSDLTSSATALCTNEYNYAIPGSTCGSISTAQCVVSGGSALLGNNTFTSPGGLNTYTMVGNGTVTCPSTRQVKGCIIGGGANGGAGGIGLDGGGGGGSMVFATPTLAAGGNAITVGAAGNNSVALTLTALAGGAGGFNASSGTPGNVGASGGSGGGGAGDGSSCSVGCAAGAAPFGPNAHAGASAATVGTGNGAGGGGAGADASGTNGGVGKACPIDGVTYAGGGNSAAAGTPGTGYLNAGGGSSGTQAKPGKVILQEFTTPSGTWHQVNATVPTFTNQGINNQSVFRANYRIASYNGGLSAGTMVRITFGNSTVSSSAQNIGPVFFGHPVNNTGTSDFQGDQVQLTFNSGSSTATIPAGGSIVSDPVLYSWTPTKDSMVSFNWAGTPGSNPPGNLSFTNVTSNNPIGGGPGYQYNAFGAGTEVVGFTMTASQVFMVSKIEVLY